MKTIAYACLLAAALLIGCRSEEVQISAQEALKTDAVADLSMSDLYDTRGILKVGNSFVALASDGEFNAVSINLQSGEQRPFFPCRLSDDDYMFSLMSFNSTDGRTVTALDYQNGRLIETTLSGEESRSIAPAEEHVISLPAGQQHLIAAKGSSFVIATGLYNKGRYLYYDLNDQTARYFLDYPGHEDYPDMLTRTKAVLYASNILRIRPDESAFVCADMYSGLIDFCRIIGSSVERIRMVRLRHPIVDIEEKPGINVAYYRSNPLGFADVAVSQERVYALYSGRSVEEYGNDASMGDILLVYDWEGNLLQSYQLDIPLLNIAYDSEKNAVYGLSVSDENKLTRLNFSAL